MKNDFVDADGWRWSSVVRLYNGKWRPILQTPKKGEEIANKDTWDCKAGNF